jgi:Cu+-exporting ATPase
MAPNLPAAVRLSSVRVHERAAPTFLQTGSTRGAATSTEDPRSATSPQRVSPIDQNGTEENLLPASKGAGPEGEIVMKKVIGIEGMMCAHCQQHVKEALEKVPGVAGAEVSLEDKSALVRCSNSVKDQALQQAVIDAGYKAGHVVHA